MDQRFWYLLRYIKFDDKVTREIRRGTDKIAAIRDVFDSFVHNCESAYNMSEFVTNDEMLPGFRGKCNFNKQIRHYNFCKQAKWRWMFENNSKDRVTSNSSSDVVNRLCKNIRNSGINLTTDNFTSVPFRNTLLQDYVNDYRDNKKE